MGSLASAFTRRSWSRTSRASSRRAGESQAFRWSATGGEGYSIEECERASQGTTITLTLKPVNEDDGLRDFTSEWVLRDIVKKYSDFVSYPVKLEVEREEAKLNADGEAEEGGETIKVKKLETLNSMKALWTKSKSEVEADEYTAFTSRPFMIGPTHLKQLPLRQRARLITRHFSFCLRKHQVLSFMRT